MERPTAMEAALAFLRAREAAAQVGPSSVAGPGSASHWTSPLAGPPLALDEEPSPHDVTRCLDTAQALLSLPAGPAASQFSPDAADSSQLVTALALIMPEQLEALYQQQALASLAVQATTGLRQPSPAAHDLPSPLMHSRLQFTPYQQPAHPQNLSMSPGLPAGSNSNGQGLRPDLAAALQQLKAGTSHRPPLCPAAAPFSPSPPSSGTVKQPLLATPFAAADTALEPAGPVLSPDRQSTTSASAAQPTRRLPSSSGGGHPSGRMMRRSSSADVLDRLPSVEVVQLRSAMLPQPTMVRHMLEAKASVDPKDLPFLLPTALLSGGSLSLMQSATESQLRAAASGILRDFARLGSFAPKGSPDSNKRNGGSANRLHHDAAPPATAPETTSQAPSSAAGSVTVGSKVPSDAGADSASAAASADGTERFNTAHTSFGTPSVGTVGSANTGTTQSAASSEYSGASGQGVPPRTGSRRQYSGAHRRSKQLPAPPPSPFSQASVEGWPGGATEARSPTATSVRFPAPAVPGTPPAAGTAAGEPAHGGADIHGIHPVAEGSGEQPPQEDTGIGSASAESSDTGAPEDGKYGPGRRTRPRTPIPPRTSPDTSLASDTNPDTTAANHHYRSVSEAPQRRQPHAAAQEAQGGQAQLAHHGRRCSLQHSASLGAPMRAGSGAVHYAHHGGHMMHGYLNSADAAHMGSSVPLMAGPNLPGCVSCGLPMHAPSGVLMAPTHGMAHARADSGGLPTWHSAGAPSCANSGYLPSRAGSGYLPYPSRAASGSLSGRVNSGRLPSRLFSQHRQASLEGHLPPPPPAPQGSYYSNPWQAQAGWSYNQLPWLPWVDPHSASSGSLPYGAAYGCWVPGPMSRMQSGQVPPAPAPTPTDSAPTFSAAVPHETLPPRPVVGLSPAVRQSELADISGMVSKGGPRDLAPAREEQEHRSAPVTPQHRTPLQTPSAGFGGLAQEHHDTFSLARVPHPGSDTLRSPLSGPTTPRASAMPQLPLPRPSMQQAMQSAAAQATHMVPPVLRGLGPPAGPSGVTVHTAMQPMTGPPPMLPARPAMQPAFDLGTHSPGYLSRASSGGGVLMMQWPANGMNMLLQTHAGPMSGPVGNMVTDPMGLPIPMPRTMQHGGIHAGGFSVPSSAYGSPATSFLMQQQLMQHAPLNPTGPPLQASWVPHPPGTLPPSAIAAPAFEPTGGNTAYVMGGEAPGAYPSVTTSGFAAGAVTPGYAYLPGQQAGVMAGVAGQMLGGLPGVPPQQGRRRRRGCRGSGRMKALALLQAQEMRLQQLQEDQQRLQEELEKARASHGGGGSGSGSTNGDRSGHMPGTPVRHSADSVPQLSL